MNIQDRRKTLTVEELRRRYNLDALDKDRKAIKLQKEQLTKVDAELNDFVEITTKNLKELQNQVDGNITTWFFNGVPTVENEPSSNWTTEEEKINHLGDLYYDQDTGYAYRWAYENNTYTWSKIVDADVVEALAVANAAQDTADSKRRVFVVQPIPPYDIGDIWIKEDTDLYRCRASRSEGNFNTADWIRATNYTDDTVALGTKAELDQFKTQITENYVSNATLETTVNSITGKVEETYTYVTKVENQVNDITTTTQTSIGENNLYITDSLESNVLEYHVEGKSEQETRSGKNLFIPLGSKATAGITITENDDGTYNISGTATASIEHVAFIDLKDSKIVNGETYILSATKSLPMGLTSRVERYTDTSWLGSFIIGISSTIPTRTGVADTTNTTRIRFGIFISAGATINIQNVGFQLELGTEKTEWEKYGAMPSPDYPSEIKTVKGIRNFFDKNSDVVVSYDTKIEIINTGLKAIVSSANTNRYSCFKLSNELLGKTLTISCDIKPSGSNTGMVRIYYGTDETPAKTNANFELSSSGFITNTLSSSLPDGTSGIYLLVYANRFGTASINDYVEYENLMIEEGSIAHSYVPYGAWAKVKITGKNIFDFKNWKPSIANGTGVINTDENYLTLTANSVNDCYTYGGKKFLVKENIKYTFYVETDATTKITFYTRFYDKNNNLVANWISQKGSATGGNIECTFTTPENTKYIELRVDNDVSGATVKYSNFYLAEENKFSGNEEYKEKEVLINLSKPNLFDKNKIEIGNSWNNNKVSTRATLVIEYEPNKRYSIKCSKMEGFEYVSIIETPDRLNAGYAVNQTEPFELTRTLNSNAKYLCIQLQTTSDFDVSILDNLELKIYEDSETDYYELSSIGDTKDELSIVDGQVVIDKKIDKVVLDGSESITSNPNGTNSYNVDIGKLYKRDPNLVTLMCSHFKVVSYNDRTLSENNICYLDNNGNTYQLTFRNTRFKTVDEFKTYLKEQYNNGTPLTLSYIMAESKQILLPNINIPLFEGINHITLVDNLETTTSIKYYRNTPISQDYVIQQQLDETNSNLSATTDKTNQNASDINSTNTNLNNNYYNKDQIDVMNMSTQEVITQIKNTVETTTTATNLQISILQEQLENGVTSIKTETGYTFDKDGLKIQKSDSEMSSLLDNDGLVVKRNETEVLTVRSSGVETENLTVRTYFTIGNNTRVENYKNGTGFFYVGGDS